MHTTDTTEKGLENLIVAALTGTRSNAAPTGDGVHDPSAPYGGVGYVPGDPKDYDRDHAVDLAKLLAFLHAGAFILQRHRRPWFSIPLLSPVWSAVFSSRNQFQVGTSRRHLGEFGLVIALILLGFMERPIRIEMGAIGVIRSHSLKIAFNIKRLSVSRRDENRFERVT